MENIPAALVEIGESFEQKYQPILDFDGWRVAVLRHNEATRPDTFYRVERHRATNEVFILTEGKADLIVLDGADVPSTPHTFPMRLNVAYNIQKSVWHHVVMTPDAHIILVERTDTTAANSDYFELPQPTVAAIKGAFTIA
jgi:ureidoglycolate hydrolase